MIGSALMIVLLTLSALHLYWGLGGRWPGHDAASLREMVVGTRGARMYGLGPSAIVAGALAAAALVVFVKHWPIVAWQHWLIVAGYVILIAVFGLRGLATYLTPIFDYARGVAFFDLNRQIYSPLCLAIAAGLLLDFPPLSFAKP